MIRPRWAVASLACTLSLAGCGLGDGLYNAPLPGGANLGSHPYTVTAEFADVLDLVPQSGVKVNDVAVGRVTDIALEPNGKVADVKVEINGDVHLPANAVASIQQTSLLGEKYVALATPFNAPSTGTLRNGDVIGESRTSSGVEVEQVFGALSLVLNGGGIGQLHSIAQELNQFAHGHEGAIRQFFGSVDRVVRQLNSHRSSITQALDALDQLSHTLTTRDTEIARVLRSFAPGIAVLAHQRKQLITLLDSLNRLSHVTVHTLDRSKSQIVGDLRALSPILRQLSAAGSALPHSLQALLTYPFTDAAVAGIKGDYLNGFATTALNTPGGRYVTFNGLSSDASTSAGSSRSASSPPPAGLLPATSSSAPGMPSTLTLAPTGSPSPKTAHSRTPARSSSPGSG